MWGYNRASRVSHTCFPSLACFFPSQHRLIGAGCVVSPFLFGTAFIGVIDHFLTVLDSISLLGN